MLAPLAYRILEQIDDITSFFGSTLYLNDRATEWTLELLSAAVRAVGYVIQPLKLYFDVPRPIDYAPQILPIIQTPSHRSWPCGHGAEAFALATVIEGLMAATGPTDQTTLWAGCIFRQITLLVRLLVLRWVKRSSTS